MSTCFKALDTSEGQVFVLTKTRWMGFVPMPHTSVTPHSAANLTRLGVFIKWTTNDPPTLARLHDAIAGGADIGVHVCATTGVVRPAHP